MPRKNVQDATRKRDLDPLRRRITNLERNQKALGRVLNGIVRSLETLMRGRP